MLSETLNLVQIKGKSIDLIISVSLSGCTLV